MCHVVYRNSLGSARLLERLAGERRERLHLHRADLLDPAAVQALAQAVGANSGSLAGLVLGAAVPPLAMSVTAESARELAGYLATSVSLLATPLGALLPLIEQRRGWVLFCSSSALQRPPLDWPHYVSAKGAIEGLAGWVAQSRPSLRTVVVRPPKMATAMTATPSGQIGAASSDAVALWTAQQLAGDALATGLTTLCPAAANIDRPEPQTAAVEAGAT